MKDLFSLRPLLRLCQFTIVASFWYSVPTSAVDWTIADLGTLGGTQSEATGINARGQVVGSSDTSGDTTFHAFLHDGTTMRDLGTLGGTNSQAFGINTSGQVVGSSYLGGDIAYHAFLHDGTTMRDLGTVGGTLSTASGINARGQVVGWSFTSGDTSGHAFLHDGTTMRDLGTLGGNDSGASGINVSGLVVGTSAIPPYMIGHLRYDSGHAFLHDGTTMRDLGTLGGTLSTASGINVHGQVVGASSLSGDATFDTLHAFLHNGTTMRDLGTLGGTFSGASGVNGRGQVIGWSGTISGDDNHVFLYDGAMRDLSTLPEVAAAGWQRLDEDGLAINDSGQIVGTGMIGDQRRAFRLHPQTTSRYMQTVDPTALFNLGCAQTYQSGLLILDFGRPSFDGTNYGTRLLLASRPFASISDIEYAVRFFLNGYYVCGGRGLMTVAVGTNNIDEHIGAGTMFGHGQAWGQMMARLNDYISGPPSLRDRLTMVGASDIELGWNTAANSRAWSDGYASASPVSYYNYGDAAGCPPAPGGTCSNNWTQADVWYVSWGNAANPLPVPEIYYGPTTTQARQWAALATLYSSNPMYIPGALTQWQACIDQPPCDPQNTPVQAWQKLMDALYAVTPDPNTVQNILYSSDIAWQN